MKFDDLDDDMIKLVSYTIVSLKPGHERVLEGGTGSLLVKDAMSPEAFASWMISRYLQSNSNRGGNSKGKEEGLALEDQKHLAVHYTVARRWPRRSQKYSEREVAALEALRRSLGD